MPPKVPQVYLKRLFFSFGSTKLLNHSCSILSFCSWPMAWDFEQLDESSLRPLSGFLAGSESSLGLVRSLEAAESKKRVRLVIHADRSGSLSIYLKCFETSNAGKSKVVLYSGMSAGSLESPDLMWGRIYDERLWSELYRENCWNHLSFLLQGAQSQDLSRLSVQPEDAFHRFSFWRCMFLTPYTLRVRNSNWVDIEMSMIRLCPIFELWSFVFFSPLFFLTVNPINFFLCQAVCGLDAKRPVQAPWSSAQLGGSKSKNNNKNHIYFGVFVL